MYTFLFVESLEGQKSHTWTLNDGGLIIPFYDSELYDKVRLDQFASSLASIKERDELLSPTFIVIPQTENEIIGIIKLAKELDFTISIRSGGHQYSGLSSCHSKCIQIDMKHFDHISYNKDDDEIKTVTVGVGVKLLNLYNSTHPNNISIIGGVCPGVGAGGHFQSSSQSVWSRSLGLGMDYIIRIKIITADGQIRNLYKNTNNKSEKDLFWAILGGSPGSWGVVIEYEFEPIKNSDYPHSSMYQYTHLYTKAGFEAFFNVFIAILNNPYFSNYNDLSLGLTGGPILSDPNITASVVGSGMIVNLMWSGIDNNDIHSLIPNHPMNKTWHQELIQPFINIDTLFAETQQSKFNHEGSISISELLLKRGRGGTESAVPPFRYINTHSAYTGQQLDQLFSDKTKTTEWIQSITNKIDELASNEGNDDNIKLMWQFYDGFRREGKIRDNIIISHDPMENDVSWPLRDIKLESDDWILFNNDDILKAKEHRDELEQILTGNQIKSNIKSFAYTDLNNVNEYDLNTQFNDFYNEREDVYRKLQDVKTRVDADNIFKGPLTIPPKKDICPIS